MGLNSRRRTYNFKSLLNLNSNSNIGKILVIILLVFLLDKRKVSYTANNLRFSVSLSDYEHAHFCPNRQ